MHVGIANSREARKTFPAFRRMRNRQICVSGKRPMPSRGVIMLVWVLLAGCVRAFGRGLVNWNRVIGQCQQVWRADVTKVIARFAKETEEVLHLIIQFNSILRYGIKGKHTRREVRACGVGFLRLVPAGDFPPRTTRPGSFPLWRHREEQFLRYCKIYMYYS